MSKGKRKDDPLHKKRKHDPLVKDKNPYPGETRGLPGIYNATIEDAKSQQLAQDAVLMHELLQEYEISEGENQWFELSLALAREYVPGFQMEAGPRGRRKKWTREKLRQLYDDVQAKVQSSKGKSANWACMQLTKEYDTEHGALYSQYKKAKQKFTTRYRVTNPPSI